MAAVLKALAVPSARLAARVMIKAARSWQPGHSQQPAQANVQQRRLIGRRAAAAAPHIGTMLVAEALPQHVDELVLGFAKH